MNEWMAVTQKEFFQRKRTHNPRMLVQALPEDDKERFFIRNELEGLVPRVS